ncbi:hypothetical protein D3C76_956690 [compost metagenome]
MSRGMPHAQRQVADPQFLAILQQAVELAAIGTEFLPPVEQSGEGTLHAGDSRSDGDTPAQLPLEVGGSRQMIGVGMGFQQPFDAQALLADMGDHRVGAGMADAPGGGIVVQHRIDDGAGVARRIAHHVAVGVCPRVEESLDLSVHALPPACRCSHSWMPIPPSIARQNSADCQ